MKKNKQLKKLNPVMLTAITLLSFVVSISLYLAFNWFINDYVGDNSSDTTRLALMVFVVFGIAFGPLLIAAVIVGVKLRKK